MITDIERHNEEQAAVWKAHHEGHPTRVPMIVAVNVRYTMLLPEVNPEGYTFQDYFLNSEVMLDLQLRHQHWMQHHMPRDAQLGLPERWTVNVDFQNSYEALWFGCQIRYIEGNPPDTIPLLADDDRKRMVFDRGMPDPFAGEWMERNWGHYEYFKQREQEGFEFHGRPVVAGSPTGLGMDGPLTVACNLRGATEVCLDLKADPDYFHELMTYMTEADIVRIQAYRERLGQPRESKAWGFADDSIQLISVQDYREHVLPYHRRLTETFGADGPNSIHLCGDATRHFRMIRDELKVMSFDTGFPVDFGWLRQEVGPDVTIWGGPPVELLRSSTPEQVTAECRRILGTGIMEGGKFILQEANNLPPRTNLEACRLFYEKGKEWGRHQ